MTSITVVTPWADCHELIPQYAAALEAGQPERVIIVDNGSSPPLADLWPAGCPVEIVRLESNIGFSTANNIGLRAADTDAVLFLNNDVVMETKNWLLRIRDQLRPGVLVGASLRYEPYAAVDGRVRAYLDGWCLAGMTADLRNLGGWDTTFEEPAYYGDNELCLRAKAAGMRLVQAQPGLKHLGNYTSRHMAAHRDLVAARNRQRYMARARELFGPAAA